MGEFASALGEIVMARQIQSQTGQPARTLAGSLGNALFWLVVAFVVPVEGIGEAFPELAPYARWAPVLCYALAFLNFSRALRALPALQRPAASRAAPAPQVKAAGVKAARVKTDRRAEQSVQNRKAKAEAAPAVQRTPTVQRMR